MSTRRQPEELKPSVEGAARPGPATNQEPITLVLIADLEGVVEPCGCSLRPKGGMDRAVAAISAVRQGTKPLLVAAGNLLFKGGTERHDSPHARVQEQLKADALGAILARLAPDIVAPGPEDFGRGVRELRSLSTNDRIHLLAGDRMSAEGLKKLDRRALVENDSYRIAFVPHFARGLRERERLQTEIQRLREVGDVLVVVLSHDDAGTSAETFAGADVVVHTGTGRAEAGVEEGVLHVYPGRGAEEVWVLRLWPGWADSKPWRLVERAPSEREDHPLALAERRPLHEGVPRDSETRALINQLFARIQALTASVAAREGGPDSTGETAHGALYVGAQNCAPCHLEAYFWWKRSGHGRAFSTLEARGRALDLECVRCHVTGFGEAGGASLGSLADLKDVGCESCHGPGSRHIENPRARPPSVHGVPSAVLCSTCHDPEHSADFEYEDRRAALRVPGHGSSR